jgi:hypothetical protein
VEGRLSGLPATERAELLEDLAGHLEELRAEEGGSLADRLGSPEAYAAELVASLGLSHALAARRPRLAEILRSWGPVERVRRLGASRAGLEARSVWAVLRPTWWVLRGYLTVSLIAAIEGAAPHRGLPGFPFPYLLGNPAVGLLAVLVAIPISIRLGRAHVKGAGRALVLIANLLLLVFAAQLLTQLGSRVQSITSTAQASPLGSDGKGFVSCLTDRNGQPITNFYPYTTDGKPTQVLLYDQNGEPIGNLCNKIDGRGQPLSTQYPSDSNGAPITNLFPLKQSVVTEFSVVPPGPPGYGGPTRITAPITPPAIVIPQLASTPTSTASPLPTPSSAG